MSYYYLPDENRSIGGIAGCNTGGISRCTNDAMVMSFERVPFKIAGVNHSTAVSDRIAALEEEAKNYTFKPEIRFTGERSYSVSQNIVSGYVYTGGIAGINTGKIEDSVNNNMTGHNGNPYAFVGGIAGFNDKNGHILRTINNGYVFNYGTVGGIVGINYGINSANENRSSVHLFDNGNAGGIAGRHNRGTIGSCGNYGIIGYAGPQSNSTDLQPAMGQIIGYHVSGSLTSYMDSGSVNPGELTILNNGFNQAMYVFFIFLD
jgi:hypothetical protein